MQNLRIFALSTLSIFGVMKYIDKISIAHNNRKLLSAKMSLMDHRTLYPWVLTQRITKLPNHLAKRVMSHPKNFAL